MILEHFATLNLLTQVRVTSSAPSESITVRWDPEMEGNRAQHAVHRTIIENFNVTYLKSSKDTKRRCAELVPIKSIRYIFTITISTKFIDSHKTSHETTTGSIRTGAGVPSLLIKELVLDFGMMKY